VRQHLYIIIMIYLYKCDYFLLNSCNNLNFAHRISCNRCHTSRPEELHASDRIGHTHPKAPNEKGIYKGSSSIFSATDWTCHTCGNVNWERRTECNICKSSKPEMPGIV